MIAIVLLAVLIGQQAVISNIGKERDAYRRNTETLLGSVDTFRTRNNLLAAKVQNLELRERDFNRLLDEDAKLIRSLKKRNEELDRLVKTTTTTEVRFETVIHDSVIVYKDRIEPIKRIEWKDEPWMTFNAEIRADSLVNAHISMHDELDVAVMLEYRKFLWWKTKVKGCNVYVVSHSPYTTPYDIKSVSLL